LYVLPAATTPTAFGSDEEERMYQFPLEGSAFQMDKNQTVYRNKLKAFLINAPGWLGLD
jgi:hypothetical protein